MTAGSPCIDSGALVGIPSDRDGVPIPQGAGPDVGAFEYYPPLAFLHQPQDATLSPGSAYTLAVMVTGGVPPLTYQWQQNGVDLPGVTETQFSI